MNDDRYDRTSERGNDRSRIRIGDHVTIYLRGARGVWTADFHFVDGSGRRQHGRRSLGTRQTRIAEQRARELEEKLVREEFQPASAPTTVDAAVQDFLKSKETDRRAKKTLSKYRCELTLFSKFLAESKKITLLATITASHCDAFKALRKERDELDDYTLYTAMIVLKTFFRWARSRGLVAVNPLAEVRLSKPRRTKHPAATLPQVNDVMALAVGESFAVLATLAFTGLRVGELAALRREDVDLQDGLIRVRHRRDWRPKTEGSERELPIHRRLLSILKAKAISKGQFFFTAAPSPQFPEGTHHINPRDTNELFQKLATACRIVVGRQRQGLTLHSLRRFFRTFCADSGVPQAMVNYWMGHADQSSMDFHYYDPSKSKEWMERVPFGEPNDEDLKRLK